MKQRVFIVLLVLILVTNYLGLHVDIFLQDSSLYALISKGIIERSDWLNLYLFDVDWLDKPHLPMWLCALSMKLFGLNAFAYKLPSFLFFLIGLWYTFKLARYLYNTETARYAVLITGSALHIILSNNDVRAEAILMGLVVATMYYFVRLAREGGLKYILLSSIFAALAVMTKGIFVLFIFYGAIFGQAVLQRKWAVLWQPKWYAVLVLSLVFTFPELYALYVQFDMHPEKVTFGMQGGQESNSSFGIASLDGFFNSGPIKGKGDISFYLHTMLWAFAPWVIAGFTAIILRTKMIFRRSNRPVELYTLLGFIGMFLIFSLSKFQLPHYTNILFPFIAILLASHLENTTRPKWFTKLFYLSTIALSGVLIVIASLLEAFYFKEFNYVGLIAILLIAFTIAYHIFIKKNKIEKGIRIGVTAMCTAFLFLNLSFYPDLLTYQGGKKIADFLNEKYPNQEITANFKSYLMLFYTRWTYPLQKTTTIG